MAWHDGGGSRTTLERDAAGESVSDPERGNHARGVVELDRLPLEHAEALEGCRVAWELRGRPGAPVVVALGGISAGRHTASGPVDLTRGWWEDFVGSGRALDPEWVQVLSFDWIGGAGESSGPPADPGPADRADSAERTGRGFPPVTPTDQANALAGLLDTLGVPRLHGVVGSSYGAMVAVAFAAHHPGRVDRLVAVSGTHRTHPMATALRAIQRRILRLGATTGAEREAVTLARALAMTTYRSADEFADRFGGEPRWEDPDGWAGFPVEDYLLARGRSFADAFSAQAFQTLSESLDLHAVDVGSVRAATTLVTVDRDPIAPVWQAEELSRRLPSEVRSLVLESRYGHDAFLKEPGLLGPILVDALELRRAA